MWDNDKVQTKEASRPEGNYPRTSLFDEIKPSIWNPQNAAAISIFAETEVLWWKPGVEVFCIQRYVYTWAWERWDGWRSGYEINVEEKKKMAVNFILFFVFCQLYCWLFLNADVLRAS